MRIKVRHISDLNIDLWTMPKSIIKDNSPLKPVYKGMDKSDQNTSNESLNISMRSTKKIDRHKNAQKESATMKHKIKQAKVDSNKNVQKTVAIAKP